MSSENCKYIVTYIFYVQNKYAYNYSYESKVGEDMLVRIKGTVFPLALTIDERF